MKHDDGAVAAADPPGADPLLTFDDLAGGYGDTVVLRGLTGQVGPGQVLGVLGRNGVGKTTLMRLLAGHLMSTAGTIDWRGQRIDRQPPHRRRRAGIAYAPQEGLVFDDLTVRDNLTLHRARRDLDDHAALFEAFPRLSQRLDQRAGSLSGGEKKLLSFTRVIAEATPLALLDEPSEGVQQENLDRMAAFITARRQAGAAFVIVEQNLNFLLAVMDRVLVLDHGAAVLAGPVRSFTRGEMERHLRV